MSVEDVIEGLNIYRAVEACGERVLRLWAETEPEAEAREGFATIAGREGNHARDLAARVAALGGQPGPSCVDAALAGFVAQAEAVGGARPRLDLFNALVKGKGETAAALATCMQGIRTAYEQGDPETRAMLDAIFVDERLSVEWCAAYGQAPAQSPAAAS